ncbi:class I SAM-dependent methyltransferase [Nodosilinea sp. LEGE 07088]|uniref:class I SAM-dependent methyltransferase n=1 Tax=Nodosilinea sp. LEGE 07088 TaxID=2777968 RepID=UPI0018824668|nr:methyltransferase domain-containing protein [Nodosilinea sp. LEGE 07088]MBE9139848.1 class I SAM-dependent methyltransferase [Nodosilinea sp. LEGE 07088]
MALKRLLSKLKLSEALRIQEDLDNPENIHILRDIIQKKPFLYQTYQSFYQDLLTRAQAIAPNGEIVELGSGASFLKQMAPHIVTSDILPYAGVDRVFSALDMPFAPDSVSAFVMLDVLHHLKDSRQFFNQLRHCLKPGGKVVMIEPANTAWSRLIYTNFHHEPFLTDGGWGFDQGGPLSGANMAIPWIIFCRDRQRFEQEYPELLICDLQMHTPFRYLLSGGLSLRQLLPSWSYGLILGLEKLLTPFNRQLGLFMTIELEKIETIPNSNRITPTP